MRVLLGTPHSPLSHHEHAANDIAGPFYRALAKRVELHVYAPMHGDPSFSSSYENYVGARPQVHGYQRFGIYPYSFRPTWSRQNTQEFLEKYKDLRPDVAHFEYIQTTEAALSLPRSAAVSANIHDLVSVTHAQVADSFTGIRYLYNRAELLRVQRVEHQLFNRVDRLFLFSPNDQELLRRRGIDATVVPLGIDVPDRTWSPPVGNSAPRLVFAGAMWRHANYLSARYLVNDVLPLVQVEIPSIELHIVGAKPLDGVVALGQSHGVKILGAVDDLDAYVLSGDVVLAPSVVEAGVLLKSLRALALGAPVILNDRSAAPIDGLKNDVHAAVRDEPAGVASAIVSLIRSPRKAEALGANARELIRTTRSWESSANVYVNGFLEAKDRALSRKEDGR